jgi:hypothetical protein
LSSTQEYGSFYNSEKVPKILRISKYDVIPSNKNTSYRRHILSGCNISKVHASRKV